MREIEIKARVRDIEALSAKLHSMNVSLGQPLKQRDSVYTQSTTPDGRTAYVRLRIENDTTAIFNMKKSVDNQLDSIEHESVVEAPDEIRHIINHLGLTPFADVTKVRRKGKVDDIELCLDEVEGLGIFIEAEKLCRDDVNGDTVREELWRIFSSLGISRDDEVIKGYDVLIREKLAA